MTKEARSELDRAITRAVQAGHLEQLRLLKGRQVAPLAFLEASRQNALLALRPSPALRPLVHQWLGVSDLRKSSAARYRQSWGFLFASLRPNATLADLNGRWWAEFVASRNVTTSTLNRDRAAVLAFLSWAREHQYETPDFAPRRLKEEPHRSGILTQDQIREVEAAVRPDRWSIFRTLLETGMRQGEVLNLKAGDVATDADILTIRSSPGSKGRGKERSVPISEELAQYLRTLAVVSGAGRIFPYGRSTIREWWAELCEQVGIDGVTLHGIRATFITLALDDGIPPVEVQKLVGHADITMTMRYYRNPKTSQTAARQIRTALGLGQVGQEAAV
jgi:integrase